MQSRYLMAWGKTPRGRQLRAGEHHFHPVAYHNLDVAACARVLLERLPQLRAKLAELLDVGDPSSALVTLIAAHDIGKFSRCFERKSPDHWPNAYGDVSEAPADPGHGTTGLRLWLDRFSEAYPDGRWITPLGRSVWGHHGQPVSEDRVDLQNFFGTTGLAWAEAYWRDVLDTLPPGDIIGNDANLERASWLVAGLTVLADWLGSSAHDFPYHAPTLPIAQYWDQVALPSARCAVARSGVVPAASAPQRSFSELTGIDDWQPTPMQRWASEIEPAPGLFIVEDSTGAGKTEAALMLAHRLIAAGHASGIYVALPTMATADGMYDRVNEIYRRLFADDTRPSIALAHGARDLHERFQTTILDPNSDSYCAEWIADDRRKTFLAQIGVGTIDQALLGILPSHYQSLRVLGLSQRVLILDEVHAYDAYMNQEIVRLLEMQAALGGSTVLLSATLPADTKQRLLRPYGGSVGECAIAYPLATAQTCLGLTETPVDARPITIRDVPLSFVATPDQGALRVINAARQGQAVLYIRNTVDEARETFETLPDDIDASLFHARFAMSDRQAVQTDALARFGKDSTLDQRRGRALIATQVVEQSLDLDFDLIVSDLAPVDLIIQRAGRLWRHDRERAPSAVREFVVVGPEPIANASSTWLSGALRGSSLVYQDHARMWLTAEVLRRAGVISAPGGLRSLIEHVYAPGAENRIPAGLVRSLITAEGRAAAERSAAHGLTLRIGDGYAPTGPWTDEERARTRLETSPTVSMRLARKVGGIVKPWAEDNDLHRAWALSEIRVPRHRAGDLTIDPPVSDRAYESAISLWSDWQRAHVPLVVVDDHGITHSGCRYDSAVGWIGGN